MHIKRAIPALGILLAASALGQQPADPPVERALQFARTTTTQDFQEAATLIRGMSEIRDVSADPVQRTVALRGPADQVAIAAWLFSQIDNPSRGLPSTTPEYHIAASRDNVLRLYHVANAATVRDFQEMATMIRTISDIGNAFVLNAPRIIALRSSSTQISMAEWLLQELDKPLTQPRVAHEFFVPDSANDVLRVFYFPLTTTFQDFQETATEIRTATQIRRAFTYNAPRAFAVRGTIEQIAQAARMLQEKGLAQVARTDSAPNPGNDATGTFQLPLTTTAEEYREIARSLNVALEFRRVYTNETARILVARGTPEQMDAALRWLQERGMPQQGDFLADTTDRITKTFQVPLTTSVEEFEETAGSMRAIEFQRLYLYPSGRIIVARGTPNQVAQAARMLHEKGWQ